ncbi:MmcQ/YjbR family DNA-binding protein [Nemorincola caseinilytica]|uniref:MmcQ/YjbR family DNA-binding protein n=1 Tax=Nemorincola caseinilytica TaxID=2054315 RepID=A0ABP8NGZ9_9BACT
MNVEDIREYCIAKENVEETFPFDEDTLVFKVNGKMFLLLSLTDTPLSFNVKCDPDRAIELRGLYENTILPGYHMSKKHWNTIVVNGTLNKKMLLEQIDHSYALVATGKPTKKRS